MDCLRVLGTHQEIMHFVPMPFYRMIFLLLQTHCKTKDLRTILSFGDRRMSDSMLGSHYEYPLMTNVGVARRALELYASLTPNHEIFQGRMNGKSLPVSLLSSLYMYISLLIHHLSSRSVALRDLGAMVENEIIRMGFEADSIHDPISNQ